jgi:putative nucleotidyltransferase with HDIG domain
LCTISSGCPAKPLKISDRYSDLGRYGDKTHLPKETIIVWITELNKYILLVDEDQLVLKSLKRSLRKLSAQWQIHYADNASKALDILSSVPVDVMIAEVHLAGDDGRVLFEEARRVRPQAARIVLTGYTDPNVIFQFVGLAHQLLSKPWDEQTLIETIQRSFLIRGLLTNERMKAVLNQIHTLPSIPAIYLELVEKLKSENASLPEITASVVKDPGMTVKILQIVNSPFYGLPMKVVEPGKAVGLLGIDFLKGIVLAKELFGGFKQSSCKFLSLDGLWAHSVNTSSIIKQIARMEAVENGLADISAIAGLLHDVGKMILAIHFPSEAQSIHNLARTKGLPSWKAELKVLGTSHAEVGAYLLGLWGMPISLLTAVLCHHQPVFQGGDGISPQVLLHVANAIVNAQDTGDCRGHMDLLDYDYFQRNNLSDHLARWQEKICSMA